MNRFLKTFAFLGIAGLAYAGPSGPPSGNYINNVSTNASRQVFNVSSGTIQDIYITGTCTGPGCGTAGGVVVPSTFTWGLVTLSTFTASSATITGPINIRSTIDPRDLMYRQIDEPNEANLIDARWSAPITSVTTQAMTYFGKYTNTSDNVDRLADAGAAYFWARDTATNPMANGNLRALNGRVTGQGIADEYVAVLANAAFVDGGSFHGSTMTLRGVEIVMSVTDVNGQPYSTGTVKQLDLPSWNGGSGAPGRSWTIYGASTQPYFLDGAIGIGYAGPPVPPGMITMLATTDKTYALALGTGTLNGPLPASNYIMTLSTSGALKLSQYNNSYFLKDNNSGDIIEVDLYGTTQTWTGKNTYLQRLTVLKSVNNGGGDPALLAVSSNSFASSIQYGAMGVVQNMDTTTVGSGRGTGSFGYAQDQPLSNQTLEGNRGQVLGFGYAPQYVGARGIAGWQASDLMTGTTSQIIGMLAYVSVTEADASTPLSTGTVYLLNIPVPTGSGAAGQTWSLYAPSTYPYFMDGYVGIGLSGPTAPLEVAASTDIPYAVFIDTIAYLDGPNASHILSISTGGVLSSKGYIGGGLATCGDSSHALAYSATTGLFSCQSLSGGSGSGIVSPGTFTWTNNFGMALSTVSVSNYLDLAGIANPSAPSAGTARFHAATTAGFTRFEQDNEAATNITLGRDNVFIAFNNSGGTIFRGQSVYIAGSSASIPNVALAVSSDASKIPAIGLAFDQINSGAFGQIIKLGVIGDINTAGFTVGAPLYVSTSTAGGATSTRPTIPNYAQRIGSVLSVSASTGSFLVTIAPFIGNVEPGTNASVWSTTGSISVSSNALISNTTFYKNSMVDMSQQGQSGASILKISTISSGGYFPGFVEGNNGDTFLNETANSSFTAVHQSGVNGDTFSRFTQSAGGALSWGPGAGAPDLNLYRSSPSVMQIDSDQAGGEATLEVGQIGKAGYTSTSFEGGVVVSSIPIYTANYTMTTTDNVLGASTTLANASGVFITLPGANTNYKRTFTIFKVDMTTNPITVLSSAGDLIYASTFTRMFAPGMRQSFIAMTTYQWFFNQGSDVQTFTLGYPVSIGSAVAVTASSTTAVTLFKADAPFCAYANRYQIGATTSGFVDAGLYSYDPVTNSGVLLASAGRTAAAAPSATTNLNYTSIYCGKPGVYGAALYSANTITIFNRFTAGMGAGCFQQVDANGSALPAVFTYNTVSSKCYTNAIMVSGGALQ